MTTYFNAASHGLPDADVYTAMAAYLQAEARLGPDLVLAQKAAELTSARQAVSDLISAPVEQVGLTTTTTFAWHAVMTKLDLAGKRVLVTEHEWGDYYRVLARYPDVQVEVLPALDFNNPDVSSWAEYIDRDVAAIFVPMVTSVSGVRYPIEAIGALPRPQNTKLIIDAAQALGQMPVDVGALHCDALVATCRKWLCGPRQTAMFWVAENWQQDRVALSAKAMAPADQNPALLIGLGAAISAYRTHSAKDVQHQLIAQGDVIRSWAARNGVTSVGGPSVQSPTVSLMLGADRLARVELAFAKAGIVAKTVNVAHVEPMLEVPGKVQNVLRLSPHVYTTDADFEQLFDALEVGLK